MSYMTIVISAGQYLSDGTDCSAYGRLARIIIPVNWAGGSLSFQLSPDNFDYHDLYRVTDDFARYEVIVQDVVAGTSITLPADMGANLDWVKVRSGSRSAPVVQPLDCEFMFVFEDPVEAVVGPTGATGPSDPGPTGPAGIDGTDGINGIDGAAGPMGPTGPHGVAGPDGPQGIAGTPGPEGPQGLPGPDGVQGIAGPPGSQGIAGIAGSTGPQGMPGPDGVQGVAGPAGAQGVAGTPGAQGQQGVAGPAGPQGVPGPAGVQGPYGPTGLQGNTGPTGPTGPQAPGATGATGGWRQIGNIIENWGSFSGNTSGVAVIFPRPYIDAIPVITTSTSDNREPAISALSKTGGTIVSGVNGATVYWHTIGS